MYLFLARVATQMIVILTVTLLGLGFPYTPTQVGLTLFTVGVPTFFLTLWARPEGLGDDLLASLARFVIPVSVLTAGFATAVYAYLYHQITIGFTASPFPGAVRLFEQDTGIPSSDPSFITASATLGAQSGLSVFVSTTALVLIMLLEPPHRIFTAWTGISPDRRPLWLALGLFVAFAAVLLVPDVLRTHGSRPAGRRGPRRRDRPLVRDGQPRAASPGPRAGPRAANRSCRPRPLLAAPPSFDPGEHECARGNARSSTPTRS